MTRHNMRRLYIKSRPLQVVIVFIIIFQYVRIQIIFPNLSNLFVEEVRHVNQSHIDHFMLSQNKRLDWISYICISKQANKSSLEEQTKQIMDSSFWLTEKRIIFCPIFKSATSAWFMSLYNLSTGKRSVDFNPRKSNKNPIDLVSSVAKRQSSAEWKLLWKYISLIKMSRESMRELLTSFIITRHPFERLVSAYRDKFERMNQYYHNLYGRDMVKMFRHNATKKFGAAYFNKENNYGTMLKIGEKARPNSELPCFWEFVQAITRGSIDDGHWTPMYKFCSICHDTQLRTINYILRFENLEKETAEFLRHLKWDNSSKVALKTPLVNSNKYNSLNSSEITNLYFSTLTASDVMSLYEMFKNDFILFNYTFTFGELSLPLKTSAEIGT